MRKLTRIVFVILTYIYSSTCLSITVSDLESLLTSAESLTVIDARNRILFQQGHIPSAINIPMQIMTMKRLPAIGRVVVYDDGIDTLKITESVRQLNAKQGVQAESLEGGFSAWMKHHQTTHKRGLSRHVIKEITLQTFEKYIAAENSLVAIDLRSNVARTDILIKYPRLTLLRAQLKQNQSKKNMLRSRYILPINGQTEKQNLYVLIDNGNGESVKLAYRMQVMGYTRVTILAGGEHAFTASTQQSTVEGE